MIRTLLRTALSRTSYSSFTALALAALLLRPSPVHAAGIGEWIFTAVTGTAGYLFGAFLAPIALALLGLANFILWVSGLVFNWAIIRTVYQFGTYFGTSDAMLTAWGIMRDVANMGLLFGFIFMGVLLILNVEGGGGHGHGGGLSAKKAIPRLIIFAVLLNFSLFTTQAVIDVSNGLASVFAEQAGQKCEGGTSDACVNVGISGLISDRAGVFSIWSNGPSYLTDPLKAAIVYIGLSIFVLITAMVLIAGAIMFVYRAVILSFLMVTSPIGFAGMAIPSLKKMADQWWSKLLSQAFFAPVYLLLIFVSLKLTETLSTGSSGQSLASALAGTGGEAGGGAAGNIQIVLVFAVVIGFMIASLVSANKLGAAGASFATQSAARVTFGSAGFVGRRTVGRASGKVAERIRSSNFGHTELGRFSAGLADKGSKGSFDLRGLGAAATLQKASGIDMGSAQKGGYDSIVHHGQEAREKYSKTLEKTDADKAQEEELKGRKRVLEDERDRLGDSQADRDRKVEIKNQLAGLDDELKKAAAAPQLRYAEDLHKATTFDGTILGNIRAARNKVTAGGRASHHAYEAIKKNAKKDKLEKALDSLRSSGGGDHAPAPAPAPAPAGGGGHGSGGDHGGH